MLNNRKALQVLLAVFAAVFILCRGAPKAAERASSSNPAIIHAVRSTSTGEQQSNVLKIDASSVNGVVVIKASKIEHVAKTLCTWNHFLNHKKHYPIRVFLDYDDTQNMTAQFQELYNDTDLQFIIDTERWKKLPDSLSDTEKKEILEYCKHMDYPDQATCTRINVKLGYVYMGYWNYNFMPYEPVLQGYDYFLVLDDDTYFTNPNMPDPFQIMAENDLIGSFVIEAYESGSMTAGIQEAVEHEFELEERRNRFLDSSRVFTDKGEWGPSNPKDYNKKPSVWTHFYGGRFDFFQSERYKRLSSQIVKHSYESRTGEQAVIGVAWALLAEGRERIWYLSKRGYAMGVFHHGWVDNAELVKNSSASSSKGYNNNTLDSWATFTEYRTTIGWKAYMESQKLSDNSWKVCIGANGRSFQ